LNDLFGIQSRAGCSCAGPYGHYLLGIEDEQSQMFRKQIALGFSGIKPGWVRINLHYTFQEKDINFILNAIEFVARHGHLFLTRYRLNMATAEWSHIDFTEEEHPFSIDNDFEPKETDMSLIDELRKSYFIEAERLVQDLQQEPGADYHVDNDEIESIKFFYYSK